MKARTFSEEEEEKLLVSLVLNKDELACLLDALILFYKQAACNIIKVQSMETTLKDTFKTDDDKVQIYLNAWVAYGKGIIDNFRQISIFPVQVCYNDNDNLHIWYYFILFQVEDIDWCLNIQAASSTIKKDVRPTALMQLNLTGEKQSKLTVEFDKQKLIDLYQNLEKIQSQLDALK